MPREEVSRKWKFIKQESDTIESLLNDVDKEYQEKFVRELDDYYYYWDTDYLREHITSAYVILKRLSQPPFKKHPANTAELITYFIDLSDASLCKRFLKAPDSGFLKLEKACRSKNKARLITGGIAAMMKVAALFTTECFLTFPGKLCRTAKLMGTLPRPIRYAVLKDFKNHQIMREDLSLLPLKEFCLLIKNPCDSDVTNPVPKKIAGTYSGTFSFERAENSAAYGEDDAEPEPDPARYS